MPEKLKMFPLLVDQWVGGTQYMSHQEKGFYLDLLLYLFTERRPIKDSRHAARIAGIDPRTSAKLWPKISQKLESNQHGYSHRLVTKIINNSGRIRGLGGGALQGGFPAQEKEKEYKEKNKQKKKEKWVRPKEVDAQAWEEFEQHRREIRAPLSNQARTKNANILKALTADQQRACVDKTIANRWTGLFPPKHKNANRPATASLRTAEDVARAYHTQFGKPPPVGKTTDEVRLMIERTRDQSPKWWDS